MGHSLKAFLAVIALAASPVSATTMTVEAANPAATSPGMAQSGKIAKSSISSSQAQADVAARKVAKVAAKKAKKCAKWARKAASAHSDRKRAKFSARYNASCVTTAAKVTTEAPLAASSSTVSDAISGVTGPSGDLGSTAMGTGSGGLNAFNANGTVTPPAASLAARFAPELVTTQIPEPGPLALLGLGLIGLALSRRREA